MKNILASKTFVFNALAFIVAFSDQIIPALHLPADWTQLVLAVVAVINIALKMWGGNTPVSVKAPFKTKDYLK